MDQAYFVIIAIFLSIFGTAYTYLSYRNKERLALIDSGLSPDAFKQIPQKGKFLLVFGLVCVGFAAGIISGFFLEKYFLIHYSETKYSNGEIIDIVSHRNYPQAYFAMVPLWIGIALLISFYLHRRNDK